MAAVCGVRVLLDAHCNGTVEGLATSQLAWRIPCASLTQVRAKILGHKHQQRFSELEANKQAVLQVREWWSCWIKHWEA